MLYDPQTGGVVDPDRLDPADVPQSELEFEVVTEDDVDGDEPEEVPDV